MAWNVGVLGAGPGVSALHLPILGGMPGGFRVVHIADGGSGRAQELAGPLGARWSKGEEQLLGDPDVDLVAICSPPDRHAGHILAAVNAGKKAVFCEKPLATSTAGAEAAIEACRQAGTVLLVGTNHLYDAAWGNAKHHLVVLEGKVLTVSLTLALPPNDRYHRLVSEGGPFQPAGRGRPDLSDPAVAADVLRQLLVGLAVHDLPAVRDLAPVLDEVVYARLVPPIGYAVGYRAGDLLVQLCLTMLPEGPDALWRLAVATTHDRVELDFPPAFVHAGSALSRVRSPDGRWTEFARDAEDGYLAQWRLLAAMLDGGTPVEYDELLADAHYAINLAEAAAALVAEGVLR
ncbi:Predicted dehydrogenase [Pseudarthrobacter enclensis]|uniref:Dehydrogenase n=1 Tax=Pseudarthrobacter enclensis TaxID=993070 RepID=A0A0V8IPW0_9MICC|nr:Gfo/Idh/MocA family oxidoreductase [Pseudarthrobacter enclensis]KSU76820.1 dehydrogenase [Pseudarthrobacter enclensis]SCC03255.1 Predicted dehydrogenase [Pseudarthrobacter enclensis]